MKHRVIILLSIVSGGQAVGCMLSHTGQKTPSLSRGEWLWYSNELGNIRWSDYSRCDILIDISRRVCVSIHPEATSRYSWV